MNGYIRFITWVNIITLFIIVVGALNWGLVGVFDFNLVQYIFTPSIERFVYILVGIAALFHIVTRDYYLPFLGMCAFPCGSLVERVPENANIEVKVQTTPNVNVIYWAAEPSASTSSSQTPYDNPWVAYQEYKNAGVAKSDNNGIAVLKVRSPSPYKIPPFYNTIHTHVHYRTCSSSGLLGRVETIKV